jgi:hypothetical protein
MPLPCHLIQSCAQRVRRRIIADERISSSHIAFFGSRFPHQVARTLLRKDYLTGDERWC